MIRREITALLSLLAACGPVVAGSDESTTDAATKTTTTATNTETTTTADPPDPSLATTLSTNADATTDPTPLDTSSSTTDACDDITGCDDTGSIGDPCDPWLGDCPDGYKCAPWANDGTLYWNAFGCFPIVEDPDAIGEPCTVEGSTISGLESCEAGAFCFHVDPETNTGLCTAMCSGTPGNPYCDDPTTTCAIEFGGYITLCLEACDPLLDECDVGICAPSGDNLVCGLALDPDTAIGEPCHSTWGCASGAFCTPADMLDACDEPQCCAAVCDTSIAQPCEDGQVCDPWYPEDAFGAPPVGVCVAG